VRVLFLMGDKVEAIARKMRLSGRTIQRDRRWLEQRGLIRVKHEAARYMPRAYEPGPAAEPVTHRARAVVTAFSNVVASSGSCCPSPEIVPTVVELDNARAAEWRRCTLVLEARNRGRRSQRLAERRHLRPRRRDPAEQSLQLFRGMLAREVPLFLRDQDLGALWTDPQGWRACDRSLDEIREMVSTLWALQHADHHLLYQRAEGEPREVYRTVPCFSLLDFVRAWDQANRTQRDELDVMVEHGLLVNPYADLPFDRYGRFADLLESRHEYEAA